MKHENRLHEILKQNAKVTVDGLATMLRLRPEQVEDRLAELKISIRRGFVIGRMTGRQAGPEWLRRQKGDGD